MAKAFPKELKEEVLGLALKREIPFTQLGKDFGISPATIHGWVQAAEGKAAYPKSAESDNAELREAKKRIRILEQEAGILRRAAASTSCGSRTSQNIGLLRASCICVPSRTSIQTALLAIASTTE